MRRWREAGKRARAGGSRARRRKTLACSALTRRHILTCSSSSNAAASRDTLYSLIIALSAFAFEPQTCFFMRKFSPIFILSACDALYT